ncbi:MAG TPA: FMN-binding protein [Candidatus Krumholzibacteria bacterium]|nr:FMN-binding protein [Candidatus Krumholzibacteria bacterium]HPD72653.1 FMN-binding protein [Candidatus Krumholzibacteria bacterium]HRY40415.1 FMN-binding protein [Candidatus Krumholzibacteria bacterium]
MRDIGRLVLVLSLIGVISAGTLAYVRAALDARIEHQEDLHVRGPALSRLFARPAPDLLANKLAFRAGGREYPVFYLDDGGQVDRLAVEAAGRGGYGGDVVVMIGLDLARRTLIGVEIVSHHETPGVGARIERESFRAQWTGLALDEPVALRSAGGDLDAISGATFSSRAMVDGTNQVIELLRDHADEIVELAAGGERPARAKGGS